MTTVNVDIGIYVEMPGVMELRYTSDYDTNYPDDMFPPEDMFVFQDRVPDIPEHFCRKDPHSTEQAMFYCIVCNCDLKNIRPLKDHVKGAKHTKKALEYKRSVMGIPKVPQNAPRQKEKKKERPVVDVGLRLKERLEEDGPAIGLEYITEFTNTRDPRDHPMYTCSLPGCKSAWGTSDDMFHHVLNSKHQRNYLQLLDPEDKRIANFTKEVLLQRAIQCEDDLGGPEGRDYEVMKVERRPEEYWKIRDRPDNWSEKKAELGLIGAAGNSNYEPIGKRRRRNVEDSQFSEEAGGWRPPTRRSVEENLGRNLSRAIADLRDSVELFTAGRDSQEAATIRTRLETFRVLLDVAGPRGAGARHRNASEDFQALTEKFEEKLSVEDRALKEVKKQMEELEEEIENYYSNRTSSKHDNIKARIIKITKDLQNSKVSISNTPLQKRLAVLWEEFENRSESLVEILSLQQQQEVSPVKVRSKVMEKYEEVLTEIVKGIFKEHGIGNKDAATVVRDKIMPIEVKNFEKRKEDWRNFKVNRSTQEAVKKFILKNYCR